MNERELAIQAAEDLLAEARTASLSDLHSIGLELTQIGVRIMEFCERQE